MPHFLSKQEELKNLEHDALGSGLHIERPHQDLSKPISQEFPSLSDRDVLIAKAVYELHWSYERAGKVFGITRQRVDTILRKIKYKLTQIYT